MPDKDPKAILPFWFGELTSNGLCKKEISSRWFKKDPNFDQEIFERFGWLYPALLAQPLHFPEQRPTWMSGAEGLLCAILVLDQFSRNIFRDTPAMFAGDPVARALSLEIIGSGFDRNMPPPYATFSYMPLMHSESVGDQERCVALFQALVNRLDGDAKESVSFNLGFAIRHRDIVARFGRFPHRNAVLGRTSSPQERAFLEEPNSSF